MSTSSKGFLSFIPKGNVIWEFQAVQENRSSLWIRDFQATKVILGFYFAESILGVGLLMVHPFAKGGLYYSEHRNSPYSTNLCSLMTINLG